MSKIIADRMMVGDDELNFRDADAQNKLKNLIVQEKGDSETAVMSQSAATKEFNKLSDEIGVKTSLLKETMIDTNINDITKYTDKVRNNTLFKLNSTQNEREFLFDYASVGDKNHIRMNGTLPNSDLLVLNEVFTIKPGINYTIIVSDAKNFPSTIPCMLINAANNRPLTMGGNNYEFSLSNWLYKFTADGSFDESIDAKICMWGSGETLNNASVRIFIVEGNYKYKDIYNIFDCTNYGISPLFLDGDITGMNKDNAVTMNYEFNDMVGTCTIKWQGSSSLVYPKKNYTVKFDKKFEAYSGWGEEKKYCLKANYIDFSHARNVVSAKLWGQMVKSRTNKNTKLISLVNGGAIDGFPVGLYIQGFYVGLYTFNIPKDGWMFGMGGGSQEGIVCADLHTPATNFRAEATIGDDGCDFSLEYATDEDNIDWMTTSLNRMINACIDSDGTDLDTTIAQYLDWDSTIDYYILTALIHGLDMTDKNYLLATYDGVKWFFSAYDMDSTYGLSFDGKSYVNNTRWETKISGYGTTHRAMELIKTYKKEQFKARYAELRNDVLSDDNVITTFANFIGLIPSVVLDTETKIWAYIPNTSTNNLSQIADFYKRRSALIDAEMESL